MTATQATVKIGDRFPDISLPILDGGELSFSDMQGKRLLLYMWGSW